MKKLKRKLPEKLYIYKTDPSNYASYPPEYTGYVDLKNITEFNLKGQEVGIYELKKVSKVNFKVELEK